MNKPYHVILHYSWVSPSG